jgi:hypothetical protein
MVRVSERVDGSPEQVLGDRARRGLLQSFAHVGGWPFGVSIKCFAE